MKNRCPRLALPLLCWTLLFSTLVGCGGSGSGSNGDTAPGSLTITAISPSILTANPPGPVQITITGTGFISTSQVQVNGSSVPTTFVSATTLEAAVPATQIVAGAKLVVTVVNGSVATAPSGAASTLVVNNPVPAITSLQPSMVLAGAGATDVLITGTSFLPTSAVTVNGGARTVTYTSATEISVSLSAADLATAGTLNLVATNAAPGGGNSPAVTFAVDNPMPVIASLAPASVIEGAAAFTLNVKGTGFTTGSTVHWNATALTGILVSPNQIDAAVPATLISANGSVQVVVTTPAPGGGQSTPATFSILAPKPVLNSISPATVPYNQPATVTLLGGGFDANSVVQWKGGAEPTTFISTSQLSVTLTAADLSTIGSGQLTVTNRAPGGGTSAALALNITNQTIPAITSVDVSVQSPGTACPQVLVHATGTNFINALLTVNGQLLQGSGNGSDIFAFLPAGFTAAPGNFVAVATNAPNASSNPYSLPASAPPVLAFCTSPAGADIYPGSTFATNFAATRVNIAGPANINSITLPAGISTATALPFSLAQAGTRIAFKAAGTLAAGTLSIPLSGSAGAVTAPGSISVTVVSSPPPSFYFTAQIITELGIAVGGSGSISYFTAANSGPTPADYTVDLTVSGLPPGTTATVNPSTVIPGDNFSVTVTASATAPESQNVPITITGTPSAATAAVTSQFTLDVTPKPGSLPGNRTDFTSTGGTPDAVVYDRQLDLIFASNPTWNRIDIISNKTHLLQQSVPVPGPQALDLSQDGSTLWIGTSSRHILSLNTTTLGLTRYMAPVITSSIQFPTWEDNTLLALADGTLLINVSPSAGSGIYGNAIWNPATNQVTMLSGPSQFFNLRSGDGTKAYGSYGNSVYDVSTKAVTPLPTLGQGTSVAAVNQDGSLLLGADNSVYQASGTLIGPLPSYLGSTYYSNIGSSVFSPDGKTLYQIGQGQYGSFIATVDVPTLSLTGVAPAMATEPNFVSETPVNSIDLSVDNTAMLIGIQTYGIGFEDATFFQNYGATPKSQEPPVAFTPNAGPLSGGTASSPYGFFDLIPDVWYGQNRGTASLDSSNSLTVVSPPGNADGPVNLKYIYPSGAQAFTAQAFSYSAYPQYPILTGSSPTGGVHGTISGYGMPADASGGTLTIGNNTAAITTTVGQYPPYTPEAFPSTYLDFTIPAGNPGYADLTVSTPNGNGTLPRAVFYAKSVTDYSTADAATDVLYDPARQQVYLSGTDHIDVFSLASKQWLNPIKPATLGTQSQFRGMALTADGTQLLATNILDNSLGVINPDAPSQTFAISIPAGVPTGPGCGTGPFAVAALAGSRAFVSSGLPPVIGGCPYNETLYFVDLASRSAATVTSSQIPNAYQCGNDGSINEATSDGTLAIVGGEEGGSCLYSSTGNAFALVNNNAIDYYGVALSGDGNIAAVSNGFSDPSGNALGSLARPAVQYPGATVTPYPLNNYPQNTLHRPRLNTSGSLYYWAYPNWFEIFDVQKGTLQLRFSLSETIQDVETPLATDPSGQLVFLITGAGLTVVDLGTAPLSIGYLSSTTATAGLAIQVRGSGFTAGITATLGGQSASVTFTDANTLTLTAPALTSGPHDLTLTRADGVSYTLASAIVTQ